jgi:hypothetical protein
MNIRYRVDLSQAEREQLRALLSGGKQTARWLKPAPILLAADARAGDDEIARSISGLRSNPGNASEMLSGTIFPKAS